MNPLSYNPSRWDQIKGAFHSLVEKESKKTWKERLEESATLPFHFMKGVGKGALELAKDSCPITPAIEHGKELYSLVRDPEGFQARQQQTQQAVTGFVRDFKKDPLSKLHQLWEGGANAATHKTVNFLNAPRSEQVERLGEITPDVALWLTGLGEAKGAIQAQRELKLLQKIERVSPELEARVTRMPTSAKVPENRNLHEVYKMELRMKMERPVVSDRKLSTVIDQIYKETAETGSGSTAAAVRYEKVSGKPIKRKWHTEKAEGYVEHFSKWLKNHSDAHPMDRSAVENILLDLKEALNR